MSSGLTLRRLTAVLFVRYLVERRIGFAESDGAGKTLMELIQYPSLNIRGLSSGWVGENSVSFSGAIGDKGVAWMLPEDYIPSMR